MKTAFTIGFFDGVHLGHLKVLKQLREKPHTTIVTFENHPISVLRPPAPDLIIPLEEKIRLLKPFADELILLPFSKEMANTSYKDFLDQFDLSHIVLGKGSSFGKNREGNEENIKMYAKKKNIQVEYVEKYLFDQKPVSSSRIREALKENNLSLTEQLLGRSI